MNLWLTDAELVAATHRTQPAAQARALTAMGVPSRRRPDGTLLVSRAALEDALSRNIGAGRAPPANGLNWSRA